MTLLHLMIIKVFERLITVILIALIRKLVISESSLHGNQKEKLDSR
jgi:hypothetical protein